MPETLRRDPWVRVIRKASMDLDPLQPLIGQLGIAAQVSIEPPVVVDSDIPDLFAPGFVAVFPYRKIKVRGALSMALAWPPGPGIALAGC